MINLENYYSTKLKFKILIIIFKFSFKKESNKINLIEIKMRKNWPQDLSINQYYAES